MRENEIGWHLMPLETACKLAFMTIEQLQALHRARPFQPFRMHLSDGRDFDVPHPEFLWHTPGGRTIFVATSPEAAEIVDLLHVTSLEPLNGTSKPGRRKRR